VVARPTQGQRRGHQDHDDNTKEQHGATIPTPM
jgi:hypothetical protein